MLSQSLVLRYVESKRLGWRRRSGRVERAIRQKQAACLAVLQVKTGSGGDSLGGVTISRREDYTFVNFGFEAK